MGLPSGRVALAGRGSRQPHSQGGGCSASPLLSEGRQPLSPGLNQPFPKGLHNVLYRALIRSQSILPFRSATTLRPFRRARAPRPETTFPSGSLAARRHSRWNSSTVTVRSPLLRFMLLPVCWNSRAGV